MNIDQRLHHAARELREVAIEPPPLGTGRSLGARTGTLRRIPALVAPVLFAVGGLVMVAGGLRPDPPALDGPASPTRPVEATTPGGAPVGAAVEAPATPDEELRIIASLVAQVTPAAATGEDATPVVPPGPTGVV